MKRLVLAPHVDDDVLGCGGILDSETVTFYCGVDFLHNGATHTDRHAEACAVVNRSGGSFWWPSAPAQRSESLWQMTADIQLAGCRYYETARRVNRYDLNSLIADIGEVIEEGRPEEIYLPWPSYNQDHRTVYEAALVVLRPHDRNHFVPRVLVYEGSQINFWDWVHPGTLFQPTTFAPIDIEEKLARYRCMKSQVRGMRSEEHLRALARLRGGEIGVEYAEAFAVLRWVME